MISDQISESRSSCSPKLQPGSQVTSAGVRARPAPSRRSTAPASPTNATPISAAPTGPAHESQLRPERPQQHAAEQRQQPEEIEHGMRWISPERRDFVDVDEGRAAEGDRDDRQADRGFGRGDGDHQEREDVARVVRPRRARR